MKRREVIDKLNVLASNENNSPLTEESVVVIKEAISILKENEEHLEELRLYKLITSKYVEEKGWYSEHQFCVWVNYLYLCEFIDDLKEIFGREIFEDGAFNGNFQEDCVAIDLSEVLECYDFDLELLFPKEEFQH